MRDPQAVRTCRMDLKRCGPERISLNALDDICLLDHIASVDWEVHFELRVGTLNGSRHANMKELRFQAADGVWRVAFAFDPERKAILLVAGDKSGISERRFYRQLIKKADGRFDTHLDRLKDERRTR